MTLCNSSYLASLGRNVKLQSWNFNAGFNLQLWNNEHWKLIRALQKVLYSFSFSLFSHFDPNLFYSFTLNHSLPILRPKLYTSAFPHWTAYLPRGCCWLNNNSVFIAHRGEQGNKETTISKNIWTAGDAVWVKHNITRKKKKRGWKADCAFDTFTDLLCQGLEEKQYFSFVSPDGESEHNTERLSTLMYKHILIYENIHSSCIMQHTFIWSIVVKQRNLNVTFAVSVSMM